MANTLKYTDATGPAFIDGTTGHTATFNVQSLTADHAYTYPDATGTLALTTGSASIVTVGTITTGVWHGTKIGLAYGGTNADLSATGGTSNFLKQDSVGATITVVQPSLADLSDASDVALVADVPLLPAAPQASAPIAAGTVTVTLTGDTTKVILNPLGTLATLTLDVADGTYGGQILTAYSSAVVTALTLTGTFSSTVGMAQPSAYAANQRVDWVWSGTEWVRDL